MSVVNNFFPGLRNFFADPEGRTTFVIALITIATGTIFYRFVEDLSWIDGLYFSVITLTTIGYGDIAPTTTAGKVFTMFYVVIGIGIVVALGTSLAGHMVAARKSR